jgi:hypothetical protein
MKDEPMTPEEFIDTTWSTVLDLSLFLANEPDDRVTATLDQMRTNLNEQMAEVFPGPVSETIVDVILKGIQARRHAIAAPAAARSALLQ